MLSSGAPGHEMSPTTSPGMPHSNHIKAHTKAWGWPGALITDAPAPPPNALAIPFQLCLSCAQLEIKKRQLGVRKHVSGSREHAGESLSSTWVSPKGCMWDRDGDSSRNPPGLGQVRGEAQFTTVFPGGGSESKAGVQTSSAQGTAGSTWCLLPPASSIWDQILVGPTARTPGLVIGADLVLTWSQGLWGRDLHEA